MQNKHEHKEKILITKQHSLKKKKKTITYVEKSAEAVAARKALASKQQLQTAPLCPSNVPIQSPVSPFLNIGLASINTNKNHTSPSHFKITTKILKLIIQIHKLRNQKIKIYNS
jgi:hypothetical protein